MEDETRELLIGSIEARLDLAVSMVEGLRADAFDTPADPADIARWEAEIEECDAELAELRKS